MVPKVIYPGVYSQELPSGGHPITGVATSVTAFIGTSSIGVASLPVQVSSFAGFEEAFGGLAPGSELSYSVFQFFLNGGTSAWVVRVPDNPASDFADNFHSVLSHNRQGLNRISLNTQNAFH